VALPGGLEGCFAPGFMLDKMPLHAGDAAPPADARAQEPLRAGRGSFYCRQVPGLERMAGHPALDDGEWIPGQGCLTRAASEASCGPEGFLCRPLDTVPLEAIKDFVRRADALPAGLPGLHAAQVYLPGDRAECAAGAVLRAMQLEWNARAPLLGRAPPPPPPPAGALAPPPVAVYVHARPDLFAQGLAALRAARGVEALPVLVVSLDTVSREMLALAEGVDFAPVRLLMHPVRKELLRAEPVLAIKEHWWWLQNALWREVPETRALPAGASIALLEEDHVVSSDYLTALEALLRLQAAECPGCWGVSARYGCGGREARELHRACRSRAVVNTGMAFGRATFEAMERGGFEDLSNGWDWTLFRLMQTGQLPDGMLAPALSRVRNVGRSGATVSEEDLQPHILAQLAYNATDAADAAAFDPAALVLEPGGAAYVPPAWEPLHVGVLDFLSQIRPEYS